MPDRPHIVVLGAGFGGLTFCRRFPAGMARITVVDRQNHHLFQPLLYQVATSGLSAPDIAQPIRSILADHPDLTVLMAEITDIDLASRRVDTSAGSLDYDWLVIGLGGVPAYFGHDEWARHAPALKSLDDALEMRRRILLSFEQAENETDEQRRAERMTTVVVGGGATGVELAGALAELARTVLCRDFDRIDPRRARVILVEGSERLLNAFPEDLSVRTREQLEDLGVEIRTRSRVQDIREGEVVVNSETIRAGNILWTAGVGASPLAKKLRVETDRSGRVKVLPDLSVPGHPEAFVLGDMAALTDRNGKVVPGLCPAAIQMGAYAARLIAREIPKGGGSTLKREPFGYRDKGSMATIGRSRAVAQIGAIRFSGYPAWIAWLFVHLIFLIGFRNRVSVLLQWTYSYLTYKRGARLITGISRINGPSEP